WRSFLATGHRNRRQPCEPLKANREQAISRLPQPYSAIAMRAGGWEKGTKAKRSKLTAIQRFAQVGGGHGHDFSRTFHKRRHAEETMGKPLAAQQPGCHASLEQTLAKHFPLSAQRVELSRQQGCRWTTRQVFGARRRDQGIIHL